MIYNKGKLIIMPKKITYQQKMLKMKYQKNKI